MRRSWRALVKTAQSGLAAALEYSARHGEHALAVWDDGRVAMERAAGGRDADAPHALYSGTKSFWGVLAVALQADGVLRLDEPVCETISEWRDDAWKRMVTLRQLLSLTSGLPFGGLGAGVPTQEAAIATPLRDAPGTTFRYGGIPLQVFGAVVSRKLSPCTPHDALETCVLNPIGVQVTSWRTLRDGTKPLPTGAFMRARDWLAYGASLLDGEALVTCYRGSPANSRYGLGFWLHASAEGVVPYASGSGGQALYVIPSRRLVVARFGASPSYKHEAFLRRLLA